MIRNIGGHVVDYVGIKELILSFFMSVLLILLSFGIQVRVSTVEIMDKFGTSHEILILYYGFPFETMGILNPISELQEYAIIDHGRLRMLWAGLFLDFALYFLLAFVIVYLFRRLRD